LKSNVHRGLRGVFAFPWSTSSFAGECPPSVFDYCVWPSILLFPAESWRPQDAIDRTFFLSCNTSIQKSQRTLRLPFRALWMTCNASRNIVYADQRYWMHQNSKKCSTERERDYYACTFGSLLFSHIHLPNHLIRSGQHVRRNCQANLLSSFKIDDEFEFRRLLDR